MKLIILSRINLIYIIFCYAIYIEQWYLIHTYVPKDDYIIRALDLFLGFFLLLVAGSKLQNTFKILKHGDISK